MPYIMNALNEDVTTQAHGKYFSWKPQEIKHIHQKNLAEFITQHRGEEGLIDVPEPVMELDKNSTEYKVQLYQIRKAGIEKFLRKQNWIVRNLEMSLRRDYETSGNKGNYLFEASAGELAAYKKLKQYKDFEAKEQLNTADEIAKIREELWGDKAASSRPSPSEPAKKA